MEFSAEEKGILTLLNEAKVDNFFEMSKRYIDMPRDDIKAIIKKFLKDGLVEILSVGSDDDEFYFHTGKVTKDMIDVRLDHIMKFGTEPTEDPESKFNSLQGK